MKRNYILVLIFLGIVNFAAGMTTAIDTVFLLGKNFSYMQISTLDTICMVTCILMEIPTGIIGDRFGHKASYLVSLFLRGIEMLLFPLVMNMYPMCLLFIIEAVAGACESGSFSVWIYETFRSDGSEQSYLRLNSTLGILESVAGIIAGLVGGYIADISMDYCFYFTGVCLFISFIGLCFIGRNSSESVHSGDTEDAGDAVMAEDSEEPEESGSTGEIVKSIIKDFILKPGPWILPLTASNLFMLATSGIANYWQPLMLEHSGSQSYSILGYTWLFISVTNIGAGLFTRFISSKVNTRYILFLFPLISAGVFASLVMFDLGWIAASLIYCLYVLCLNCFFPIINAKFYNAIPEGIKATALSFSSVIESAVSCIGLLLFGYLGNSGLSHIFIAASIVMAITSVFVLVAQQLPHWNPTPAK